MVDRRDDGDDSQSLGQARSHCSAILERRGKLCALVEPTVMPEDPGRRDVQREGRADNKTRSVADRDEEAFARRCSARPT
jgi:hypothetical protein